MPVIELETRIKAPIKVCFDLSTSIDLHIQSTGKTKEKAIAGKTSGHILLNETVTWEATHFWIRQTLTSKITAHKSPYYFRDEQLEGAFKKIEHDHFFEQDGEFVLMKDRFEFESPYGVLGKCFNVLVLKRYLRNFLIARNQHIKTEAESGKHLLK